MLQTQVGGVLALYVPADAIRCLPLSYRRAEVRQRWRWLLSNIASMGYRRLQSTCTQRLSVLAPDPSYRLAPTGRALTPAACAQAPAVMMARALSTRLDGDPLGIITIEDVLEEILQQEIVDETDRFVDNDQRHKVRRLTHQSLSIRCLLERLRPPMLPS